MAVRLTTYLVVAIVAATLIAGLIVGAQRDDTEGPVDLIVQNAKVFTADAGGTMAEAVAVRGNQILRVGSNREINRLRRPQTIVIDAEGGAVLPGFNDAHVHFLSGGLGLDRVDVTEARTLPEIQASVRAWAEANPDRAWVIGRGWRPSAVEGGAPFDGAQGRPVRQQLDAVVADRPVFLLSADGGAALVNTKALRLAGIDRRTQDPVGGTVARDAKRGEPTGLLTDGAVTLVERLIPPASRDERARALRAAIAEAHRHGVTSIHDVSADAAALEQYDELRRSGDLNLRVYASIPVAGVVTDAELDRLDALRAKYPDDPLFKTGAVQITVDGTIDAHAAALLEPYATRPAVADPLVAPDDLNRTARLFDARGWQLMTDASGDRAVRMALDAYAHTVRSNPVPPHGRRHRIEHVELADPADLSRLRPLNAIASVQPLAGGLDLTRIESWSAGLGPDRAARVWALKSLSSAGARLAFGSDWPSAPLNPMIEIHAAVARMAPDDLSETGWLPSERIGVKAAVSASTAAAAYASFDEHRKGSLTRGMLADLVVLTTDIFSAPPSTLASTGVAATVFDGKIVYRQTPRRLTH